jgi:ABC-type glutathione transport system ATPase component
MEWSVGVIVGRSGTGKSTIARQLFKNGYIRGFEYREASFLDDFPENLNTSDITKALGSVGFSSPPYWLKSYEQLSQGEKMRVDVARAILTEKPIIVFDEFTSARGDHSGSLDRKEIRNLSKTSSKRRITISMRYRPQRTSLY